MFARTLSAGQIQGLLEASLDAELVHDARPFLSLASRASAVVRATVAILERRAGAWSVAAQSVSEPHIHCGADSGETFNALVGRRPKVWIQMWTDPHGAGWTLIRLAVRRPAIIAIHGDWVLSSQPLLLWAKALAVGWNADVAAARTLSWRSGQRLSQRLAATGGLSNVSEEVVHGVADALGARLAALAVLDETDRDLMIVATHGYSAELVKHLRIKPGAGVIGSAFESDRTLYRRPSGDAFSVHQRRPRYRTDSFIAMPIRSAGRPLGVMCVADRLDDQAFTRRDGLTLRALLAPAALALARERALIRMRDFAHGAAVDPLSGTFNRRYFEARLEEELQRSHRDGGPLALLMIDIDDFKSVNDSFGHLVGDAVIRDVADILRRSVRVFDVCARYGGEEFAVLMPGISLATAARVGERIRERIEAYRSGSRTALRVTASVGLAAASAGLSAVELIARADSALYLAKEQGKNRLSTMPV